MIFPVRCFTCGKVIGGLYEEFQQRKAEGEKPNEVMDDLGLERYCCRRIFVAHVDLVQDIAPFD